MTTPAEHAAIVREGLGEANAAPDGEWLAALDALQAQAERRTYSTTESGAEYTQELQARAEAAEAERDRATEKRNQALDERNEAQAERDRLAARTEELEAALRRFVGQVAYFTDGDGSMAELVDAEKEARAALDKEKT